MQRQNKYYRQVQLLVRILPIIASETSFALKGGTALNLFLRDLPRLSVDIDLTYLPIQDRKASLKEINAGLARISKQISRQIPDTNIVSDNPCKLFVRQNDIQVKIEVNEVIRGAVHQPTVLQVSQRTENEFGFAEMQLLSEHDLHAGKICAALDRQHPRDLFDIKYFLENYKYTPDLIETFIVYLISHNRPINEVLVPKLKDISQVYQNEFVQMTDTPVSLAELINAREKMLNSVHGNLSDKHKEFLISFKSREPVWSLLNLTGIENLPAVQWKMLNLQNMADNTHETALIQLKMKIERL